MFSRKITFINFKFGNTMANMFVFWIRVLIIVAKLEFFGFCGLDGGHDEEKNCKGDACSDELFEIHPANENDSRGELGINFYLVIWALNNVSILCNSDINTFWICATSIVFFISSLVFS